MEIKLTTKKADLSNVLVALFDASSLKNHPFIKGLEDSEKEYLQKVTDKIQLGKGKHSSVPLPSNPDITFTIMGLGEKKSWNTRSVALAVRKALSIAKDERLDKVALNLKDFVAKGDATSTLYSVAENLLLADYSYNKHKSKPEEGWPEVKTIQMYHDRTSAKMEKTLVEALIVGNAVNDCRDLCNTPGGLMTPASLAKAAEAVAKEVAGVKVKVLEQAEIKKLGMGGVMGVSQGSDEKPKFIILEYGPAKKKPLVLIGKGVTFDSGGLNIKGDSSLLDMRMDMSGGAAVIKAVDAIARLKLPVRVIGLVPAVENMPSGASYRPGDLLKTYKGKTIEVINTDAEGRVIMADALGYAQDYDPQLVVDVATLTGGAVVALGKRANALFANQEKLYTLGKNVAEKSGDYAWPLPLWDEYDEEVKGTFGDVSNSGKYFPYGSAISAATFLKQFVGDHPWIHLDIAPMMVSIEGQYLSKGSTGTGVRFLVELAREYKNK